MRVSFIQPRHGTPFVTILSIAVEQESDRGLSATRPPPFASPSYRAHRFFSISREDLLSLPPIPINPFPRIDDRIHTLLKALPRVKIRSRHSIRAQRPRLHLCVFGVIVKSGGEKRREGDLFLHEFLIHAESLSPPRSRPRGGYKKTRCCRPSIT